MAQSSKALFRATRPSPRPHPAQMLLGELPEQMKPEAPRDPLDYDPTPPDATAAFLAAERAHILRHGARVWEPAVGGGHMAKVLVRSGFTVTGSDIVDRGYPGTEIRSFYAFDRTPAAVLITNPPYCEVNARDGHGRWLRHAFDLGVGYIALLLNADWSAARINGMDALFRDHPPSIEYLCCWKIDLRGGGSPPQRNSWMVWDTRRPALGPDTWVRTRLYRDAGPTQEALL